MEFPRKEQPILNTNKDLQIQITDWFIPESDRNRPKPETVEDAELYTMCVYGTTKKGATVSVRVTGYEPYFYVKPPESWESYSDKKFITETNILKSTLLEDKYPCVFKGSKYNRKITKCGFESHLSNVSMIKKKDFWGFTNNHEFRFIKVTVKSLLMFNNYKYYFESLKKQGFKMYESNIDPFLRYVHEMNIKPCGWVSISDYLQEDNDNYETRCDYNIVVEHQNISPIDNNTFAPLLIASFDIECTSSHGDFPVAKKDYKKTAQDFAQVAKAGYSITLEFLLHWFEKILKGKDVVIEKNLIINKVYVKNKKDYKFSNHQSKIEKKSKEIIKLLDDISNYIADDDEENEEVKPNTLKEQNVIINALNEIFIEILPQLEGDKIIQIGTTVHKYGSEKIIYKNIISLNSCNKIDDADVIECDTEKQVLREWKNLIVRLNPDILTGYNIFGFDMEYIWNRAEENDCIDEIFQGLGRNLSRKSTLIKQELSSSALGDNILKYFDMDGTVVIDLLKIVQRDHKLDSYKLDNVSSIFIGDKKDDLKPCEIFEKFKGCSNDRCIIAKYCIQDCALVNKLIHKLKILENNIGMANVCLVPLNYLFKRGQGIKIFSLVAKQCMDKGFLIPTNKYSDYQREFDMEGYEGAVVLEPKEGIYLNEPIVVFDYGSLYPSSMIARNLSHDCYVMDNKYIIDDPNIDYIKVSYDEYTGTGDKKVKTGVKECIFAKYKDGRKGVIPDILCMLLQERKNTRSKIEHQTVTTKDATYIGLVTEKDNVVTIDDGSKKHKIKTNDIIKKTDTYNKFEQDVLDALQLAYKITANSLYGQIGARTSQIYMKDIAACTTATGREMIMLAKDYVETNYNANVIYGDSVMPYTPLTYNTGRNIRVTTFENLEGEWFPYNNFKSDDNQISDKEQFIPNYIFVWTHTGWSRIKRIIRHKTKKRIYRVITHTGVIDVTEDHSLLNEYCEQIKPDNCQIGQRLLHKISSMSVYNNYFDEDIAYMYGIYVAAGNIFQYEDMEIFEISSYEYQSLYKFKNIMYDKFGVQLKLIFYNNKYILKTEDYSIKIKNLFKCCHYDNHKIVPYDIMNSNKNVIKSFRDGYFSICDKYVFNLNQQVLAQSFIVIEQMLGNYYVFQVKNNLIEFVSNNMCDEDRHRIVDIKLLHEHYYGYVYDIETEQGVFHGGIGDLIVKNTDSIFCSFPLKTKDGNEVYGKDALPYAIEVGKHVEKNIVSIMPSPQKLNYEKTLYPFILFSKKRYVGNLYEFDINKFKQKSMGIVLKRRDNANIVKKIYGGIIDIILNKQDLKESIVFLKEELSNLVEGKTKIEDLVISKSLKGSYVDPTKIAHKVLADRIGERDPGNKPQVNDRIPYVYIYAPDAKLQGDKIENPDYIIENNLKIDYLHYITNQIMNPVLQLYALCLEELPNYNEEVDYWINVENELKNKPLYQNDVKRKHRLENLKLNKVKELLFDEFINKLVEPKIKKVRKPVVKKGKVEIGDEINEVKETKVKKPVVKKGKVEIGDEINETKQVKKPVAKKGKVEIGDPVDQKVDQKPDEINSNASIKVTLKTKTKKIESVAYIYDGKKKLWKYTNDDGKSKDEEIINIITQMIEYAKEHKVKLIIDINSMPFKKEYSRSLMEYKEFEKNADANLVQKSIDENDVGRFKSIHNIIKFEKLIQQREHFSIK